MVLDSTSLTVTPKIVSDAGVEIDNITIDGTEIDLSSGSLTVDAAQNIILDHDSGHSLVLAGSGTSYGSFFINNTTNLAIATAISGAGIEFFANGSERMKIASDGKVGIGTSSPDRNLTIFASSPVLNLKNSTANLHLEQNGHNGYVGNNSSSGFIQIFTNNGNSTSQFNADGSFQIGANSIANLKFSQSNDVISITAKKDGTADVDLAFITQAAGGTSAERMRIDSDGNLLLGTTTRLNNSNTIAKTTDHVPLNIRRDNGASDNSILICVKDTNTAVLAVRGDGDVENTNGAYGALSDERLKSNIVDANSQLEDIKKVKVRNYTLDSTGETHIGVIAQELEESGMGGLVVEREEGYKGVKYSILFMKAIKAIQEQQEQIEALQSEINSLKGGE
jgi:hypothetical protein